MHITPSMLIAPPSKFNPPFDESVIILAGQKGDTIFGFILNRPIALTLSNLLEEKDSHNLIIDQSILFGGPNKKNCGFLMYEHEEKSPLAKGFMLCPTISISPSLGLLKSAIQGDLNGRFELFLGCTTWKKEQLFFELSKGEWLHLPFSKNLIFDIEAEQKWSSAYKNFGFSPYCFMNVAGGAQA